jgi:hypothetical protein
MFILVNNIGVSLVTPVYSICQKWMFIKCVHFEKLKYVFRTHNNNYYIRANVDMLNVRICCCEHCFHN